jgi:GMP synthase-like glutamine amidotransferase
MSLLVFQHHPIEDAAELGKALIYQGHRLRTIRLFEGEPLPVDLDDVDGIVSMGGPMNVDETKDHRWIEEEMALLRRAHERGLPIVGLCLGCQLLAAALGGQVGAMRERECGWGPVKLAFPGQMDPIYAGIPWQTQQFHVHGQEVKKLPAEGVPLAGSPMCKIQAFRVGLSAYGFQYHFELDRGKIDHFAHDPFVTGAGEGQTPEQINELSDKHYPLFRHLGDRLANRIALLLFPIDKRVAM